MATALSSSHFLARQTDWQDIGSRLSTVRPVSCQIDPMRRYWAGRRFFTARDPETAAALEQARNLFEWAYGFRRPSYAGQRWTRRAPSAGSLYPSELFLVLKASGHWQVLYYHFETHRFYDAEISAADRMAGALGICEGRQAILLVSVLWRTVQRYGVRGYRYCLLDGAHVASNFVHAAQTCGGDTGISLGMVSSDVEDMLDFGYAEALIAALICDSPIGGQCAPLPPLDASPSQTLSGRTECPPMLSPVLSRVISFHRETLPLRPRYSEETFVAATDSCDDLELWASRRYSAKDFTGAAISFKQYAGALVAAAAPPPVRHSDAARLIPFVIRLRAPGSSPGCARLDSAGGNSGLELDAEEIGKRLWAACQRQNIIKSSAFAIVLSANHAELASGGPTVYRHTVLNAGFVCAELYREAARSGLGTTSIGGFSDLHIAALLGAEGISPIVIQAFGAPSLDGVKVDAATICGKARASEPALNAMRILQ